jgi:UDP-N-acetylmuramate dehydrogenase
MTTLDALATAGVISRSEPLAPYMTYRFGGAARWFAEVTDTSTLQTVLAARLASGTPELLILGRGSNLVIADAGVDGLVIRLAGEFAEIEVADDGVITAGGAVPLPRLARAVVKAGRGGLEWFVGIPGSVGGAVRMNAGGHGSDTSEWIVDATVVAASDATRRVVPAPDLGLSYRHSDLGPDDIVVGARFRSVTQDVAVGEQRIREITQWRREHQPGGTLNAGSVFKNPPGDSAGRIIDALGLKGLRVGGAVVSDRHANFFEAREGATAQDVYDLVWTVQRRVAAATGVELVPEIRFAGSFRATGEAPQGGGR